jgi:hypothetical protein
MPGRKGETWNESEVYKDAWTLREVRRITTMGEINTTPTYHTNTCFSADGEQFIFWTKREDRGAVCRVDCRTGDITQLTEAEADYGFNMHVQGGPYPRVILAPHSRWAIYKYGRRLRAVHIDTLEERELIVDLDPQLAMGIPSVTSDEQHAIVPVTPQHPDIAAGRRVTKSYHAHFASGEGMGMQLLRIPLTGGAAEVIYAEDGPRQTHAPASPVDPNLLILDRDFAPRYWGGSDGKTTRLWLLRLSTGALTELPPADPQPFQVHSCWTYDGSHVLYHGKSAHGGYYIGAVDLSGATIREYGFHRAEHYGHVGAMGGDRPAVLVDGNLSDHLLLWVYYDAPQPRVEVVAAHNTQWNTTPGQSSHPHPHSDASGRWITFNAAQQARTDIYLVKV